MNQQPPKSEVDATIDALEQANQSPRQLAAKLVADWRSDSERHSRPVTNRTDTGAPLLPVNRILDLADPGYLVGKH